MTPVDRNSGVNQAGNHGSIRQKHRVLGIGWVAEWSKAVVLKTTEVQASAGSNPVPSAFSCEAGFPRWLGTGAVIPSMLGAAVSV